jgi:hypothetical protein
MGILFFDPGQKEFVRDAINSDPEFKLAAKFFSNDIQVAADTSKCIIKVRDGVITDIVLDPTFMDPWDFFIKASTDAWQKFLQPVPPPYHNSLFPAMIRQTFEVGGDLESLFAHFWPVNRMLDIMRELQNR